MESIKVLKVAVSGGMFLTTSFKELLPGNDERTHKGVSCTTPVHIDLAKSFQGFTAHLALICEEITNEDFINAMPEDYDATQPSITEMGETVPAIKAKKNSKAKGKQLAIVPELETEESLLKNFDITSVEFKQTNGISGIVLTGQKKLSTGKWMGIGPTPLIKENDNEYSFVSQLFEDAELLKYEVGLYIIDHKYAPPVDPELPFGDGPAEGEDSLFMNRDEDL